MITILVDKAIYRRLSKYIRYICAPTDPKHWVPYDVATDKWNHIIDEIIRLLSDEINGGRICPYPIFGNQGKYRMIQIQDLKTRTTVWDVSFEDIFDNNGNITKRIVHGIELDKVLASIDESVRHITQSQLCRIVESAVMEVLNRQQLNEIYFHKPGVEKRIGEYEVVDGNLWDGKVDGIRDMGWVQDVRLYSSDKSNGKTYALYKRCDNGKFFFVEVVDDESNPKKSKVVRIKSANVPEPIVSDALSLVRRDRKGLNLFS